jgi:demethylmenaquinone methyltransferase / 2-methoxy-6-polyprenyl-1,4-benzoquinol methylase
MSSEQKYPDGLRAHPLVARNHSDSTGRAALMRELFNGTARYYDIVNRWFSLGTGAWYRRTSLISAGLKPYHHLLDIAVGTGLVAHEALAIIGDRNAVIGVDLSEAMLAVARRKLDIPLVQGLAEALPIAGVSMDFVSMGYALRHLANLEAAFSEAYRVLRPGGTLLLLEIGTPRKRLSRAFAKIYIGGAVPLLSIIRTGDRRAYQLMRYHWKTIVASMPPEGVVNAMQRAGFSDIECRIELDVFQAYRGRKW